MEENGEELSAKRICRFCMTQDEPLTNIYAKDSRLENAVPLPLQIMACVSIEVFNNDGMPSTICGPCRVLMDRSYRFKQICKQSDSALRQYPTTGVWPEPIPLPEDIAETIDLIDRKRTYSESQDSLKDETEDSAPSPKRNKTYIELKPVKSPQKTTKRNNPTILNSQASSSTKLATPSKVLKIKRKNTVVEENTEQYILKEDYDEDFTETEPSKPAVHVPTDVFPCEHCDRSFPLKQLLDIHMRHHTRERKYKCDLCAKRFFSKYDLGKHMSVHSGIRPFACVACGKTFARATLLHRHEKIHVDTPKFLCNSCDKTFLSLEELDRHESNHKKRRPFACTLCPKRFAFKQGLERHEVIHARNKPFNCQYCDEGFTTPGKLARHVTAHAGSRPYPCKLCPKSFLLSHHLTRHLKSHTGGSLQTTHYKCDECEKVFLRKDDLIYHSAVHATQNLTCPLCKEQFDDIDTVTDHIKSHTEGEQFPCEFCDLIFTNQERLTVHSEQSHNDVKQEIDDNEEEDEQNDSNDFEDPLQMLNSITKNNQKCVETPVRRSQRSGKVRDYAKMVKSNNTSSEEDEEDYDNEENESEEEIIEKVKSTRTKDVKTYQSPTKVKETEKNVGKSKIIPKKQEILNKRAVVDKSKTKVDGEISARGQRVLSRNAPKLLNKIPDTEKSSEEEDADDVDDEDYEPEITEKEQVKTQPKILNKSVDNSKLTQPKILNKSVDTTKPVQPKILNKSKIMENDSKDITISPTPVKLTKAQLANVPIPRSEIVEMKIGDKMVKVQKIIMTKSEVEAMARQGKIEMKGGAMLLKQGPKLGKAIAKTMTADKTSTTAGDKTAENILPN